MQPIQLKLEMNFDCPRECVPGERCRWHQLLPTDEFVGSHTLKVETKFTNQSALEAAAKECGAQYLGKGKHRLFDGEYSGIAIKLKDWKYPIIITENGSIMYDNYNSMWGKTEELEKFRRSYIQNLAKIIAISNNWTYNEFDGGIRVFAPDGAYIDVLTDGTIKAEGFVGNACHQYTNIIAQQMGPSIELEKQIDIVQME